MLFNNTVIFLISIVCVNSLPRIDQGPKLFELSVIHLNDFHARYEETSEASGQCKDEPTCIAGLGRIKTTIDRLLEEKPDSLVLNAGDNFQGTMYYSVFKYNITAHFLNTIPFDAITIGNHEFDDGLDGVTPFMKLLKAPLVLSNVNDTLEPGFQGLYNKSTVVERNGKKIGIIGVLIQTCNEISKTGQLSFFDESDSVNEEAERLVREEDVFTNIVLSHSGYDIEKLIAQKAKNKISLVVGGHSHTFLYSGDNPPGPDKPAGPYPTVIKSNEGKTVLVTQASAYSKYLGNITIFYDDNGDIKDWSGVPAFMDHEVIQDPGYMTDLQPYEEVIQNEGGTLLGSTLVCLDQEYCKVQECLLGNFVTDAMVYAYTDTSPKTSWTKAAIAFINSGGLRTVIIKGNITYSDLITAQPFGNQLYSGDMTGQDLLDIFELTAKTSYSNGRVYVNVKLLQVSGVKIVMDLKKPADSRITSLKIRCADCQLPVYEDVDLQKVYKVIVPSFIYSGGDGFTIIAERMKNVTYGELDLDILSRYLKDRSPIYEEVEGRIEILGSENLEYRNIFS